MDKQQQKEMSYRIKLKRESLNYTQEQISEMINISLSSYSKIENAFQRPSLDTLIKISTTLNLSLDYIVFGNNHLPMIDETEIELVKTLLQFSDINKLVHASEVLNKLAQIKKR